MFLTNPALQWRLKMIHDVSRAHGVRGPGAVQRTNDINYVAVCAGEYRFERWVSRFHLDLDRPVDRMRLPLLEWTTGVHEVGLTLFGGRDFYASPSPDGGRTVLVRFWVAGWGMFSCSSASLSRVSCIAWMGLALTGAMITHGGDRLVAASPDSVVGADDASWVVVSSVTYQENHDPAVIWLADGRRLHVIFGQVRWEQVEAWEVGRPLLLVFHRERGALLVDPATRGELPVIGGFGERHPLDELLAKELDAEHSTAGLAQAYLRNAALWEGEIERIYGLLAAARIPPELASKFQTSRAAWHEGLALILKRRAHSRRSPEGRSGR